MTSEYELALVVNAKIEDAERAAVVDKAKGYIERFGGKIGEIEEWGKRKLAYEIQKMDEAYYYFIPFTAEPDCPNELEKRMEDYRARAQAIANAEIFEKMYAISECPAKGLQSPTVICAQAANELLNVVGIKASFVMVHPQMFPETISAANPTGSRRKASSITTPLRKKPWNVIRS